MSAVASERLPGLLGHELRNPLASAMTGAMLARDMIDGDDPRADVLDGVLRDLDRMTGLIDGWLAMARGAATERGVIRVHDLLARAGERNRAQLICCPPQATVHGDRTLLGRVVDNLCENARNAGAANVRIAAQCADDEIDIHVEDDGGGVAAADVTRLFDVGWSGSGGTGLGLHAVAATLAAHGGRVRCTPLPRGTRFTITLPIGPAMLS